MQESKSRFRNRVVQAAFAVAVLCGVALAQKAGAMEKISDAELSMQNGGARFTSGRCSIWHTCGPAAACHPIAGPECSRDTDFGWYSCDNTTAPPGTPICDNQKETSVACLVRYSYTVRAGCPDWACDINAGGEQIAGTRVVLATHPSCR